jgi:hypothetical protein
MNVIVFSRDRYDGFNDIVENGCVKVERIPCGGAGKESFQRRSVKEHTLSCHRVKSYRIVIPPGVSIEFVGYDRTPAIILKVLHLKKNYLKNYSGTSCRG